MLGEDHLSNLIIKDSHFSCKHFGIDTLNHWRQSGFWILHTRNTIRKVLEQCVVCKKINKRFFTAPVTPKLPPERVNFIRAFSNTGIDYTGHFFVKVINSNQVKVYILLYTCVSTRSVNLEIVNS